MVPLLGSPLCYSLVQIISGDDPAALLDAHAGYVVAGHSSLQLQLQTLRYARSSLLGPLSEVTLCTFPDISPRFHMAKTRQSLAVALVTARVTIWRIGTGLHRGNCGPGAIFRWWSWCSWTSPTKSETDLVRLVSTREAFEILTSSSSQTFPSVSFKFQSLSLTVASTQSFISTKCHIYRPISTIVLRFLHGTLSLAGSLPKQGEEVSEEDRKTLTKRAHLRWNNFVFVIFLHEGYGILDIPRRFQSRRWLATS